MSTTNTPAATAGSTSTPASTPAVPAPVAATVPVAPAAPVAPIASAPALPPVAASFAELQSQFGDDPAIVVEAQTKGWTLMQAMGEALKRSKESTTAANAAAHSKPSASAGGSAVPLNAANTAPMFIAAGDEPVARALATFKAEAASYLPAVEAVMQAKDCTRGEATALVNKLRPELRAAYAA